jgi:F420-dependent oxidoreductase-like protein
MDLGLMVEGQEDLTWERWRRIIALGEELGFESLWRSDHLLSIHDPSREALETWVALTVVAAETRRLVFGPLVCPITFRHPSLLAKMAAAVDGLSGGRLVLGLGAGWYDAEHLAYGIPFPPLDERMARLEEGIEVIRRLLGDEPASFQGRYYQLDGIDARPKPQQRPGIPLLIGGLSVRRTLPLVARYADEWNLTTNSPALYRERAAHLEKLCSELGRDPQTIRRSVAVGFIVGGSDAELEYRCAAMRRLVPTLARVDTSEVPEAARAMGWICGTPDELVARLRELADAGVQRAMLQHNDHDDDAALRLLAREVLPAVS